MTPEILFDEFKLTMGFVAKALTEARETNLSVGTVNNLYETLEHYWDWLESVQTEAKVLNNLGLGYSERFLERLERELASVELVLMQGAQ